MKKKKGTNLPEVPTRYCEVCGEKMFVSRSPHMETAHYDKAFAIRQISEV